MEQNNLKPRNIRKTKAQVLLGESGPWINHLNTLKFIGIDVKEMLVSIENFKENRAILLEHIIDVKNRPDSLQTPLSVFRKDYNEKHLWIWKVKIISAKVYAEVIIPLRWSFGISVEEIMYKYNKIKKEEDLLIFYSIHLRNIKKISLKVS
jgi:hypothetical protein